MEATVGSRRRPEKEEKRIRERRVAVIREQGRKRLRVLLGVVVALSLGGVAWLVVQSPLLALEEITVRGATRETPAVVRAAAGVSPGTALPFVDTGAVARRVEALPWVAHARVHRELPHGLTIVVTERVPAAWVRRAPGAVAIVDRSGRVLADATQPPEGLPEVQGVSPVPAPGGHLDARGPRAVAELPDALRAQVGALALDRDEAVLYLAPPPGGAAPATGEVRLGPLESVGAKGAAALAVLDELASVHERVRYLDVRVPGAPTTG